MRPLDLQQRLGSGLLSFPVTHFDRELQFDKSGFCDHVAWLQTYGAAGLIVAGGTGEFFSLAQSEVIGVLRAAKETAREVPIVCGCGYGTRMAIELAQAAEAAGADGLLLLPHYLVAASQEGLKAHIRAVCDSVSIGVVVYNRDNSILTAESLLALADACDNLIGFKDGSGRIDIVTEVTTRLGDRLVYIGGMPTAELFADAYGGAGVTTYSSAIFNFMPDFALQFYRAHRAGNKAHTGEMLRRFFYPYARIRDRSPGYAVSIIKAGMRAIGRDAGPVRPPLTDLTAKEQDQLSGLIHSLGRQAA